MWANEYERIKILAQEMVKAQQEQAEARSYTPVREAKPPKPKPQSKFKAGSQEWFKALPEPPSLVDQIAAGAICMRTTRSRSCRDVRAGRDGAINLRP